MTRFQCGHCGAKLKVPDAHAGKEGRCPRCHTKVTVPPLPMEETPSAHVPVERGDSGNAESPTGSLVFDAAFPQIPRRETGSHEGPGPSHDPHEPAAALQEPEEGTAPEGIESAAGSRLPWPIDVFLYPFSLGGAIHLVGLWLLVSLLCPSVMQYVGLGMEFIPLVYALPVAYVVYYLAECIRAGADRRAPDSWMSPGESRWDCLTQFIQVVGCVAVCFWPVSVYYIVREQNDGVFWLLLAGGGFFLPMILLAVLWFDSYSGLNPFLIVGSILRTFLPYIALVLFLAGAAVLFVKMGLTTYGFRRPPPLPFVLRLVQLYLLFVAAGLLGKFYHRYKERLSWEV